VLRKVRIGRAMRRGSISAKFPVVALPLGRHIVFLVGGLGRRLLDSVLANDEGDKGRFRCDTIAREIEKQEDEKTVWNNDEESVG